MPSTYTLNNGIELIATGEQSGTWGDTTNVNLALIDTALDGQVTITLASAGSSGSPNALPISDGSASNGRNRLVIFDDGGDLGATAFVQLTPNDAEKIVYIRNNLSGGRAITLFQGTYNASNDYEVPAGTTAVVFFNGGGAGAVAANVFNNAFFDSLRLGGVSVTAILDEDNMASDSATALATQQSIKAYVDAQVGANNELSEILANGNTSGGNNIQMTTTDEVQFRDTALKISSSVDGQLDIAADVELEIVAPTLDINASTAVTIDTTTMTMTGSVNVVGDLDVDNLNINGNSIISTNTDGNIALTPNGTGEVDISKVDIDGGTIDGTVIGGSTPAAISGTTGAFSSSGFPVVINSTNNNLFKLALQDTAATVGYIGASSAAAFAVGSSAAAELFRVSSTGSVGIGTTDFAVGKLAVDGDISINASTAGRFTWNNSGAYLNWIESDGVSGNNFVRFGVENAERLRITSTGSVGIGTSSPASKLEVASGNLTVSGDAITTVGQIDLIRRGILSSGAGVGIINFQGYSTGTTVQTGAKIQAEGAGTWTSTSTPANVLFYTTPSASTSPAERMRITSAGSVGIGTNSPNEQVEISFTDSAVSLRVNSENAGTSASNYSEIQLADVGTVRAYWRNFRDGSGQTAFSYNDHLSFQQLGTERVRITSTGSVGIGTSSPNGKLDVSDGAYVLSNGTTYIGGMGKGTGIIGAGANDVGITTAVAASNLVFGTVNTERMRIDASGNVGIGTVPFSWGANNRALQVQGAALSRNDSVDAVLNLSNNAYRDSTSNWFYGTSFAASLYQQGLVVPGHVWFTAPSGTADGALTWQERMRITDAGSVGIGTSSPARQVTINSSFPILQFTNPTTGTTSNDGLLIFQSGLDAYFSNQEAGPTIFETNNAERMRITSTGSVGIGTSSPAVKLTSQLASSGISGIPSTAAALFENSGNSDVVIAAGTSSKSRIAFGDSGDWIAGRIDYDHSDNSMRFGTAGSGERLRIDSSGNVGIGTSSPADRLVVNKGSAGTIATFTDGVNSNFVIETASLITTVGNTGGSTALAFKSANTERMRIDTSGNLLVGKTSDDFGVAGCEARPEGAIRITRNDNPIAFFNRLTSDGRIVNFYKDGTLVGNIGTAVGYPYVASASRGLHFGHSGSDSQIVPCNADGADLDNTIDLGAISIRFDDIYATNGTIQTSDRNEKQDIEALSDAEQRVAVACKDLLRKFRWKSSVEEKGDDARIHFGIIAQDLQAAFEAEGLDAGRYAMFIHSTWTDEETGEERSRMGVRYPQLLAFIIAAI
jgi:hypothetical protein